LTDQHFAKGTTKGTKLPGKLQNGLMSFSLFRRSRSGTSPMLNPKEYCMKSGSVLRDRRFLTDGGRTGGALYENVSDLREIVKNNQGGKLLPVSHICQDPFRHNSPQKMYWHVVRTLDAASRGVPHLTAPKFTRKSIDGL
jgi:hypothetical protein